MLQQLQHLAGVLTLVGLGAQGPNGRAAAGVEDALLQGGGIGQPTDDATEGIHLMHQLALGRATDGGVAGLPGDPVEVEGEEGRVQAEPGRRERRLTAGMATPHHDHVEAFGDRT